ncbi:MAG TPA: thiamine-phosphate kinase [Emcibacteraceae bacterium]|nr:thiamine-phosphate kinase [Emcibacteraceae bacterium]HRW28921.1 thiamine-phosphate kinase [Emcibacteraceae bacterium]
MEQYFAPLSTTGAPAFSLSNDAAIFEPEHNKNLIFTKDMLVGGKHFFENDDPYLIAKKALRVNLSDLASMGAEPLGYLLGLALPDKNFDPDQWLSPFVEGLKDDQDKYHFNLWGGDTVSTTGPITVSVTAIGQAGNTVNLTRSGANTGDDIYVSGTLGDAAAGLLVLKEKMDPIKFEYLIKRYHLPEPRIELGKALSGIATSMMDISDGLLGDISHICRHSKVGAEIKVKKIPVSIALGNLLATKADYSSLIWSGGDDYELLFTTSPDKDQVIKELSEQLAIKLTKIGKITKGKKAMILDDEGAEIKYGKRGFSHF